MAFHLLVCYAGSSTRHTTDTRVLGNGSIADAMETASKEEGRRKQPGLTTLRIETILNAQSDAGCSSLHPHESFVFSTTVKLSRRQRALLCILGATPIDLGVALFYTNILKLLFCRRHWYRFIRLVCIGDARDRNHHTYSNRQVITCSFVSSGILSDGIGNDGVWLRIT